MRNTIVASALALSLAACAGGGGINPAAPPAGPGGGFGPSNSRVNPRNLSDNILQFAVGTANLYGTSMGLNVVVTYRQPSTGSYPGRSGALVSSPTIHLPAPFVVPPGRTVSYDGTSTAWFGPYGHELKAHIITATSQAPGSSNRTTFGQSGGAFGLGIEPFNLYGPADAPSPSQINSPFQWAPYPVPLYQHLGTSANPNVFEPWGGPPAFDLLGNGQSPVGNSQVPTGLAGISMGLDVFNLKPPSGTYGMTVLIQTSYGNVSKSATTHLKAAITLPPATAPAFVADGKGGGTMAFTMPAHATEAYVQVTDYGPKSGAAGCNTATQNSYGPVEIYYTIFTKSSGTLHLPDTAGPSGAKSLCHGDEFTVQTIAFDYPVYEASYTSGKGPFIPSPQIHGSRGQDDVTISPAVCHVAPKGKCTLPLPGQPQ